MKNNKLNRLGEYRTVTKEEALVTRLKEGSYVRNWQTGQLFKCQNGHEYQVLSSGQLKKLGNVKMSKKMRLKLRHDN